jgi:hypothetical protein
MLQQRIWLIREHDAGIDQIVIASALSALDFHLALVADLDHVKRRGNYSTSHSSYTTWSAQFHAERIRLLTYQPQSVSILIRISFVEARMLTVELRMMEMQLVFSKSKRKLRGWVMIRVAKLTRMRSGSE